MGGSSIFFGGSIVAAVVAGAIALFAPCCLSVMLPAYLASSFQNRRVLVAMTFLFAAGVATVILPIALGAATVRQLITGQHTLVFTAGGLFMIGLGVYTLLGGQIHIPMPGRRAPGRVGPAGVYSLGVFSGVASSCCAPVLAGVIALSGVASSFLLALALGAAYVFGMVAPLFVISLLWERHDWRSSRLFRPRSFTWRLGPIQRTVSGTNLASGVLLAVIGTFTLWIGLTRSSMPTPTGWQATLSVRLQHYGAIMTRALSWVPSWLTALLVVLAVALLARRALRQTRNVGSEPDEATEEPTSTKGESREHRDA